eukprot:jgi/Tetstr1/454322/TSEL_041241.t1
MAGDPIQKLNKRFDAIENRLKKLEYKGMKTTLGFTTEGRLQAGAAAELRAAAAERHAEAVVIAAEEQVQAAEKA